MRVNRSSKDNNFNTRMTIFPMKHQTSSCNVYCNGTLTFYVLRIIDAHGLKIQGGYLKFLPKSRGGVKGFRKNCQGGSTYFRFYCISITKFFVLFHTPSPPYPPPVGIYGLPGVGVSTGPICRVNLITILE